MKQVWRAGSVVAVALSLAIGAGCEWSGPESDSINTSQGAGIDANYSGVYDGLLSGGKAVSGSTLGTITRLVISQSGNELDVTDNLGNRYKGRVGSPGTVANPNAETGAYPEGATVVESQMSWEGNGVEFVGVVHVVTVNDVKGNTTTDNRSSTDTTTDNQSVTRTETRTTATNTIVETVVTIGTPADPFYQQTTTTVTYDTATGRELDRTVTKVGTDTRTTSNNNTTTFTLTEANSQLRLEGTWIESGLGTSSVDALSPGGITVVTTTTPDDGG